MRLAFYIRLGLLIPFGAFLWAAQKLGRNPFGARDRVFYDSNTGLEITTKPDGTTLVRCFGNCAECEEFGVDTDVTGADGRSVCDRCRDETEQTWPFVNDPTDPNYDRPLPGEETT